MAKKDTARIGFIGAGWWATANHMPLLKQRNDVEMTAVCRLGKTELGEVKKAFGFQYATEDYRRMLDETELDGVVVTSPHTLHFEHARAALERGLHVMVEKPMCTKSADAKGLVRLAEERGLHVIVPYGWHYRPFIQEAKRRLDAGCVGNIESVVCHMASPIRGLLRGHTFDHVSNGGGLFAPSAATWADPILSGGGYGQAQMSHSLGLMSWLTGLTPQEVFSIMAESESKVEMYDAMTVRFEAGVIGTLSGSGDIPEGHSFQLDVRVFGSEGMLLLDVERARLLVARHDGDDYAADVAPDAGAYSCEGPPNNFVDLILGKATVNYAPGEAAMRSVMILDAAYRSARSGRIEPA
ncbi:MAG: Gfo/Idh/MocA family oxidoreductase [candidate division Zixibacteria bacterium]|nr:Gfo/Idh/MocA family oxidoreductase [candidate division Zixibacteria bacterium]